jgi:hypothetical protein
MCFPPVKLGKMIFAASRLDAKGLKKRNESGDSIRLTGGTYRFILICKTFTRRVFAFI